MVSTIDNALHRSRLFQLLALGFAHPVDAFHRTLVDGSYPRAIGATATVAGYDVQELSAPQLQSMDFEAGYIELFQLGRRGKPLVSLNAGDYSALNEDEASRPEFLLRYSDWYRHFGLRTDTSEDANELPDHLVCQLEFLAWVAHLEAEAGEDGDARRGYQRAQRDFLQRHLTPFLALLVEKLPQIQDSPVSDFFGELTAQADTITRAIQGQLETITNGDSPMTNAEDSDQIAAVNLWG